MQRHAIVGSRDYLGPRPINTYVESLPRGDIVVSGGAKGVDTWAVEAANILGLETKVFLPDWDRHGKSAGFIRNREIVENADRLVAFWNGFSRGTLHSINLAKEKGIPVTVYGPEGELMEVMES